MQIKSLKYVNDCKILFQSFRRNFPLFDTTVVCMRVWTKSVSEKTAQHTALLYYSIILLVQCTG